MKRSLFIVLGALILSGLALPARAVQPDEILADPKLEATAREISAGLRCLVCQNQSIDDSDAPLARDLRIIVRERLTAGDTKEKVAGYVVSRYGEFILLEPQLTAKTVLLWLAPFLLLAGGGFLAWRVMHPAPGAPAGAPQPLTEAEKKRLAAILDEKGA